MIALLVGEPQVRFPSAGLAMPPDPSDVPSRISAPPPLPKFLYRTAPFSVASGSKPIVTVAADVVLASTTDKPSAAPKATILLLNDLLKFRFISSPRRFDLRRCFPITQVNTKVRSKDGFSAPRTAFEPPLVSNSLGRLHNRNCELNK